MFIIQVRLTQTSYKHYLLLLLLKDLNLLLHDLPNNICFSMGVIRFPTRYNNYCVLRSPFVFKSSREHFSIEKHKVLLFLNFFIFKEYLSITKTQLNNLFFVLFVIFNKFCLLASTNNFNLDYFIICTLIKTIALGWFSVVLNMQVIFNHVLYFRKKQSMQQRYRFLK
jgi:hypothetical protein